MASALDRNGERHAWLLCFTPKDVAEWRLTVPRDRPTQWALGRFAREVRQGDVVFYFARRGSLLYGWGIVEGIDYEGARAKVSERCWRTPPVELPLLGISDTILDPYNFRAFPQEDCLRLSPEEAQKLGTFMRPEPDVALIDHNAGAAWRGHRGLYPLMAALEVGTASPLAEELLDLALGLRPAGGPLSVTRLWLAALSLDSAGAGGPEAAALQALRGAVESYGSLRSAASEALEALHGDTVEEIDGALAVLKRAIATDGSLAADTIVAHLVGADSLLVDKLASRNIPRELLPRAFEQALLTPNTAKLNALLRNAGFLTEPGAAASQPKARPKTQAASQPGASPPAAESATITPPASPSPATPPASPSAATSPDSPAPTTPSLPTHVPALSDGYVMVGTPGNDDPWARGLDDKLGVGDEAKAFARFVAAAGFTPPIAIGIFGEWGSGKSFFMRLMYEHIERLRAGKPSKEAPEAGDDAFLREIVQIRFNAWHYAETNLWASLVDHIFAELDRWLREANQPEQSDALLENLSTARELTLEAAEQLAHRRHEQRDAATRLEKAEQALRDARVAAGASKAVFWSALGSALKANDGKELAATKDSFVTAAERLGIRDVQNSAQDFQKAVSVLGNEVERARLFKQQVSERLSRGWVVVLIAFSCVAVPVALVLLRNALGALPQLVEFKQIHASLLAVSGWLGSGAVLLATVTGKVKGALDLLEDSKRRLDGAVEREVQAQAKEVVEEQQKVVKLTAETEEARALLTTTSDRLAQATRQYASGTGRGRLMSFIRARATGGDYARHLGLVATIRKDFEELAANVKGATQPLKEDLEKARQAFAERVKKLVDASKDFLTAEELAKLEQAATAGTAQEMQPSFERIVLYIDDLDRCPSDKVAAVLQAVHLLLTFPLFVVVVAVDVRWVGRALKQHYPDLLAEEAGSAATAHDYLEKIFQLPYWVRPMQAKASRDFLADRAKLQLKAASRAPAPPPIATPDPPRTGAHRQPGGSPPLPSPRRSTAAPAAAVIEEPARGAGTAPPSVAVTANRSTAFPESVAAPSLDARTLTLADDELGYIDALAPHVASSPRRALRFLNVYRVIKASLKPSDLDALTNGGYRALMTQLAVATGAPNLLDDWLAHLQRKPAHPNLEALTTAVSSEPWFSKTAECARLTGALGAYGAALTSNAHVEEPIGAIANYGDITRRYSFTGWTRVVAAPRSVSNVHADNDPGAIDPTPPAE